MDPNTLQKLKEALSKSTNIGIAVGTNPTVDEMGAALALYLLLITANKRVTVSCPTDPIVEISSLVGIDKVQRYFGGNSGDLVVSFPYKEGEIDKVSYTLENNVLNIIVKATDQGLTFEEKDVTYRRGSGMIDLLIVVGASSLGEIGDVINSQKLQNISVINIDNDVRNIGFGDIVLVEKQASSVSEYTASLSLALGFTLSQDAAQNLLSGIVSATRNFQEIKTSTLAFEMSSLLMKRGAQRIGVVQPASAQQQSIVPEIEEQSERQAVRQLEEPDDAFAHPESNEKQKEVPPLDWLTPKVYRGSSEI
jgi:nanoRNase/pAp phosphatase (c-di-AMP/oligoRNAs hydrolase)